MAIKVVKDYGAVATHSSRELKLQVILNADKEKRLALVSYKDGMSVKVTDITEEKAELRRLLEEYLDYRVEKKTEESDDVVHTLCTLPATDGNYDSALEKATVKSLQKAIEKMRNSDGKHATRIKRCENKLNSLGKGTEKAKTETKTTEKKEEKSKYEPLNEDKKPKIIQFKTDGNRTYGECYAKITKEKATYTDSDSQYVLDGLAELCKVDPDFRNNFMRDDKTYAGFMEYMYKAAQNGYCNKIGNTGWLDRDKGLGLAIDYYNADIEQMNAQNKKKTETTKGKKKKKGA